MACRIRLAEFGLQNSGVPPAHGAAKFHPMRSNSADAVVSYAANIFTPHHTTAMAATMQAAVKARSRTWIFIVSIPFRFATPHGRYAIPQHVGNFGVADRIAADLATLKETKPEEYERLAATLRKALEGAS
jgi:hypothetical protein